MDGQADQAPITEDALANIFLADTSSETGDQEEDQPTDDSPDLTDKEETETEDDSPEDGSEDDESEDSETPDPKSGRKWKVTVKGEDGADLEQEVDEKELVAGYQRHSDYTRKTQELSKRESEAVDLVRTKITEANQYYQQQAQFALAAVQELAGLKTPQQMLELAQTDPAAHGAELARQQLIQSVMQNIQHGMQQNAALAQKQAEEAHKQQFHQAWGVLGKKGIDKPKLVKIFETIGKEYGVESERFSNISDPRLVLIMADAVKYRELLAKKPEVQRKASEAPRLPQKQNVTHASAKKKRLQDVLKSGRGGTDALAAVFAMSS